ncbi:hypothetical protein [Texcoconibacillus texcoconensis]|uniref:Uncharacterized protein n=1 Tax=Texcoconibacillus texcoconensis TaxID=1095777 RepID=A0A840QTZ4_9BACI|nr:hypothetical protein [Texcoconibacillus texcoconensis]MBB5174820.1 hypothetical protein [Texcoconibacillus texcoconensis]
MFSVNLTYKDRIQMLPIMRFHHFRFQDNRYVCHVENEGRSFTIEAIHLAEEKKVIISFPKALSLQALQTVNETISLIAEQLQAEVDDQETKLGYIENGQPVYIYHNFRQWVPYLTDAKYRSLKGQHVDVYNAGVHLISGLLTEVDIQAHEQSVTIQSLTLITTEGEETLYGDALQLEAKEL